MGAVTILAFKFWPYAIILVATIIVYIAITIVMTRHMPERNIKEAKASSRMSGHLADDVANILTLKAYSAEKRETELAKQKADDWYKANMAIMRDFNRLMLASDVITNGIRITALILAVLAKQHNLISIGTILLMVSYTNTVTYRLHEVRHIIRNYNRIIGDATEMVEILHTPIEIVNKSDRELVVPKGAIEFKNVTFSHNQGDELFKNFHLKIKPGQKVGLVGHSGSGKSSLTSLIMRFHDVDSGQILIDGTDISEVSQASLRQAIAYVPQEPMMFHRSIADNIAFGKPEANRKEVETAAKQACADEFIEKLPKKYDTLVGERGVKLSGGQRQRIAIARAIIKGAPILVLDEATSALDSESEKLIQDAMDELMIGRTSVVVAHRLSTIAKLDRIIVLDNGKIIEDGTHQKLIELNGTYAHLWKQQSGGFLRETELDK
jgi:ATP-binding cassette subfamily B protein